MSRADGSMGWEQDPGSHYLDCDTYLCGVRRRALGTPELRSTPPPSPCQRCLKIYNEADGKIEHRHRWVASGGFGNVHDVCQACGEERATPPGKIQ